MDEVYEDVDGEWTFFGHGEKPTGWLRKVNGHYVLTRPVYVQRDGHDVATEDAEVDDLGAELDPALEVVSTLEFSGLEAPRQSRETVCRILSEPYGRAFARRDGLSVNGEVCEVRNGRLIPEEADDSWGRNFLTVNLGSLSVSVEAMLDDKVQLVAPGGKRSVRVVAADLLPVLCTALSASSDEILASAVWNSTTWPVSQVAPFVNRVLIGEFDHPEFEVNGETWGTLSGVVLPSEPATSLAALESLGYEQSSWGETPANSGTHTYVLVRTGDEYHVIHLAGGDVILESAIEYTDDTTARDRYWEAYGELDQGSKRFAIDVNGDSLVAVFDHTSPPKVVLKGGQVGSQIIEFAWDESLLQMLQQHHPDVFDLPSGADCSIEAPDEIAKWLPLYLRPEDDGVEIWVNGTQWFVLPRDQGEPDMAVPEDEPRQDWASFGWTETASMMSGYDHSKIGPINDVLLMAFVSVNDEWSWQVSRRTTVTNDLSIWLYNNELSQTLEQIWPAATTGPIELGFTKLLMSGQPALEDVTADLIRPSEWREPEFGITDTATWDFAVSTDLAVRRAFAAACGIRDQDLPALADTEQAPAESDIEEPKSFAWVPGRIERLQKAPRPSDELRRIDAAIASHRARSSEAGAKRKAACERLGVPADATRGAISRHVEALLEVEPERLSELWNMAYDAFPELDDSAGDTLVKERAGWQKKYDELAAILIELEWPPTWDERLAPLWQKLGGTKESALAWAAAGWDVTDVLTSQNFGPTDGDRLDQRVQLAEVPGRP